MGYVTWPIKLEEEDRLNLTPEDVGTVRHCRSNDESNVLESARKSQEKEAQNRKAKIVENTTYFGFTPNELTPLPRNLESQPVLNKVTKIQNFPQPFRNVWKKAILSEASVSVFQDSFWWIFCQLPEAKQSKDVIFSRIFDSFVALFFNIPTAYKDRFFHHYRNCLAQALYAGFCEAFPDSYKIFGNPFKATLTDTIFEWISGVRPQPMIWETWQ
ncbi:protein FAM227B-like [Dendronephthya gigantea]|uniref:protein FAM227B-like n=1 Tax=Dendronephthya gigantea TaxID=151771 RepID=UPI00106A73E9|nr:protein FAM227B-like [Dendronephthya gigantea]